MNSGREGRSSRGAAPACRLWLWRPAGQVGPRASRPSRAVQIGGGGGCGTARAGYRDFSLRSPERGGVAAPDKGPLIGSRALWPSGTPRTSRGAPDLRTSGHAPRSLTTKRGAGRAPARRPLGGARLILMRGSNDDGRYRSLARGLGWGCGRAPRAAPPGAQACRHDRALHACRGGRPARGLQPLSPEIRSATVRGVRAHHARGATRGLRASASATERRRA